MKNTLKETRAVVLRTTARYLRDKRTFDNQDRNHLSNWITEKDITYIEKQIKSHQSRQIGSGKKTHDESKKQ